MIKKLDSNIIIAIVPITLVDHMWPKCIKHVAKVVTLCPDDFTIESIEKSVFNGGYTLVTMSLKDKVVACAIIDITTFESGFKVLAIHIVAGGGMSLWSDRFLNMCHLLAKEQGCDSLQGCAARDGWFRYLKDEGWTKEYTTMRCRVKDTETKKLMLKEVK